MTRIFNKKYIFFYKRLLSISLAFVILFNATTQVFANIEPISPTAEFKEEIETAITNALPESNKPTKNPKEFLADLLKSFEEASQDDNQETQNIAQYHKLNKEEYANLYNNKVNEEYNKYIREIETKAQEAIAAFDTEAQEAINEQRHVFNTEMPLLNFKMPAGRELVGKKAETSIGQNLKLTPAIPEHDSHTQVLENMAAQEAILNTLKESIAQQREEYLKEVNTWKRGKLSALQTEKKNFLTGVDAAYETYSNEYDGKLSDFYSSLVDEVIENFKQTNDMESKKNFVSILFFLTSIKSPQISSTQFIQGENKNFILKFLRDNFSAESNACASNYQTRYKSNYQYGTVRGIGGSASAGIIFENSDSKETYLHIEDEEKCDLALSSMLPFANLNGNGYALTNFIKQYYQQPLFGSMLEITVKSLLLTNNNGEEALTKFIDESINLENDARDGIGNNFWDKVWNGLDWFTLEGIAKNSLYDGKFCNHNLCSSANAGADRPNAWEEVAYMLADAGKIHLLDKAIAQCKIAQTKNYAQHMECKGIYPFLFGALIAKPELANKIPTVRPFSEFPTQEMDASGHIRYVTPEQVQDNIRLNQKYDITLKHTPGEWIGALLTGPTYEDLHPADVLRMNNLLADSSVLNQKRAFKHYDKESDWYRTKTRKFNVRQVLLPLSSYGDFLISIIAIKDLLRFGFVIAHKAVTFTKMLRAIRTFKALPNSFNKAVKLTHLLQAKNINPKSFAKMNNFIKFTQNPSFRINSAIVARAGVETQTMVVSVSGKITGVKNGVLEGTREFARPLSGAYKGKVVFEKTPLGGMYAAGGANAFKATTEEPVTFKGAMAKVRQSIAESPFNPFVKPSSKDVPNLNLEGLTLEIVDKNGNPIKIEKITIEDNVLFINGEMFKTFKAIIPEDQLQIVIDLVKQHDIAVGIDGFYIKPLWNNAPTKLEKAGARWHNSELFDVYDGSGNVIMQMGLNRGFKNDLNLIQQLDGSAKLVYINNTLHIQRGANLARLENIKNISIPKTSIFNMTKNTKAAFLTDLFKMPLRGDKVPPLLFRKTGSKIVWPFITQALSYSAASTSLMMTMEKPPFNFSPAGSVVIGLFLPYIWSFTSPFMVPLVKLWGAKPVLLASMAIAGVGLGVAIANGYHGNVTNELDEEGRVIPKTDENGNIIEGVFETKRDPLPTWPLFVTSAATGLASAGIRASANILIKGYELNRSTLTASMVFKNIGAMAFTAVPFVANALAKMDNDTFKDKRKDFSVTYPVLLGLTALAGAGIAFRMPKMNVPHYKPVKADFLVKPWKLLFSPQIAPYTFGMMGLSSLEGYVYFKGVNSFARDTFEDYGVQAENAKFMASLFTAIPQFTLRLISPRKAFFSKGLFNSAVLATAGTLLMSVPSDNLSRGTNTAIGAVAGTMLGLGTAQVFQYSQKLVIAQAAKMPGAPIKDAQTLYSMSNLGFILPTLYAMSANQRKSELNESEFEATKNTFYWPMIFYLLGTGAIADAEKGFKVFPAVMNGFVKPALRYSIEGSSLRKTISNYDSYLFDPALQQNQFTPSLMQPNLGTTFNFQKPMFSPTENIFTPINTSEDDQK